MADEVDVREPASVEQLSEPGRKLAAAHSPEPRQLDEMHSAALGEAVDERRPPPPRARQAVHRHEVDAVPDGPQGGRPSVDGDARDFHRGASTCREAGALAAAVDDGRPGDVIG